MECAARWSGGRAPKIVGEAAGGVAAVRAIKDLRPDLVFLDVRMPQMDGIEVLREVGVDALPAVVFVTAYDHYAVAAFDLEAVDYLVKPIDPERFDEAFRRARRRLREGTMGALRARLAEVVDRLAESPKERGGPLTRLAVEERGRTFLLSVGDVRWFESDGNYVRLHTGTGTHLIRRTLKSLERDLDSSSFLRIRRSVILNVEHLEYVERGGAEEFVFRLQGGAELTSARRYFAAINAFLREHR